MAANLIPHDRYKQQIKARHAAGSRMQAFYMSSLVIAFLVLIVLLSNIINQTVGLIAVDYDVDPATLADEPLEDLDNAQLSAILQERASDLILRNVYENLSVLPSIRDMSGTPLSQALRDGVQVPEAWRELPINDLDTAQRAHLLELNFTQEQLVALIYEQVVKERVLASWNLDDSLTRRGSIQQEVTENYPTAELKWYSWLNSDFIRDQIDPNFPAVSGVAPAVLGSVWLMVLVIVIAVPLGVGAAIYLEEYATDTWYNRIVALNIRNLAGVPSIIYGMLGLAVFARALNSITNGSTILTAALTLSLLVLPIIIIATQESLRAVPKSIREASYGLGATRWQTISRQVLPAALPGILTGTIISISRAVGETAPLIVIGAATFIATNPDSPLDQFTALPMMIYNWTSHPNPQFQNTAAAAIVALLILLLSMNAFAIILRNRTSRRR